MNVKIPVTNTKGQSSAELLRAVVATCGANVAAVFTLDQVRAVTDALDPATPAIASIFAGRIADTGVDPIGSFLRDREGHCAGLIRRSALNGVTC